MKLKSIAGPFQSKWNQTLGILWDTYKYAVFSQTLDLDKEVLSKRYGSFCRIQCMIMHSYKHKNPDIKSGFCPWETQFVVWPWKAVRYGGVHGKNTTLCIARGNLKKKHTTKCVPWESSTNYKVCSPVRI
jgi:hypothetical protein